MEVSFPESKAFSSLEEAVASINTENGHAQPNRFEVLIFAPPKLSGAPSTNPYFANERNSDARKLSYRCESVSLPGRSLNQEEDTNIYGPSRQIVKGVTYAGDISLTFLASGGLDERVFFEEWQKQAFDESSWNVGYYNDYVSTIEIYLLDKKNRRRYGIKLIEAYPKEIDPTELSLTSNSEVIKLSVTFSYRYWTTLDIWRSTSLASTAETFNRDQRDIALRIIAENTPKVLTRL
jgi:hypothetical protein